VSDDVHSPTTAAPLPPPESAAAGGAVAAGEPSGDGEPSGAQQMAAGAKKALSEASEKPEALVGAAFAGGLVFAMILKRVTRG
jgi:hypothetical protein